MHVFIYIFLYVQIIIYTYIHNNVLPFQTDTRRGMGFTECTELPSQVTLEGTQVFLRDVLLSQIYNERCRDSILLSNVLQSQTYSRKDKNFIEYEYWAAILNLK